MARRQYGSGSIFQRKADGKWIGQFDAGYTASGGRRKVTVVAATQAQAKKRMKDKMDALARGEVGVRSITVKAWSDQWLEIAAKTVRPKSFSTDQGAVRKWIVPTLGHRKVEQLTPADLRSLVKAVTDAGHTTTTARRYVATLKVMLKAAVQEGYTVSASVLAYKPPKEAAHDREALSLDHSICVLSQARTRPDGSRWVAALLQGMRQGECLGLGWDAVDLDREQLTISWQLQSLPYVDRRDKRRGFRVPDGYEARRLEGSWHLVRPKSKAGWRVIPLVPWFANALREWQQVAPESAHGLVWPAAGGSLRKPVPDREEWAELQALAGIAHPTGRPYVLHEARHATATLLMELGVPESIRIAIMGHSRISTTRGYEHVDVSQTRDWLSLAADKLGLTGPDGPARTA